LLTAWQNWCCPNALLGYLPLRNATPHDVSSEKLKKRLSDFRYAMLFIESCIENNISSRDMTITQANELFHGAQNQMMAIISNDARHRRLNQINWSTVVNIVRKHRRE
jgi:hypothetical protein